MSEPVQPMSEIEKELRERFLKERGVRGLPSDAAPARKSSRVESLVLPEQLRGKMPLTKSKYLIKEDPLLVEWEREVRKFLRKLTPEHENRVSAVMMFEWATGIRIADLMEAEKGRPKKQGRPKGGSWRSDLRKINQILTFYFGKPYMTYIAGRKVPKAYKVRKGYLIKRHRPLTLTLWAEYIEGTLNP